MPAVFFFADKVIDDPDSILFAAFGSFAILVLADFGGPRRVRLVAYLLLAAAGMGLIALGTLCSQEPWLAVAGMAVVTPKLVRNHRPDPRLERRGTDEIGDQDRDGLHGCATHPCIIRPSENWRKTSHWGGTGVADGCQARARSRTTTATPSILSMATSPSVEFDRAGPPDVSRPL